MRIEDLRTEHIGQDVTLVDGGFTFAGTLNGYELKLTTEGDPPRATLEAHVTIGTLTHVFKRDSHLELRTHAPFSPGGIIGHIADNAGRDGHSFAWDDALREKYIKEWREGLETIAQRDAAARERRNRYREARRIRTIIETSTPDEASQTIARHFAPREQPNGYVCAHGMSSRAEGHQNCDRPNRDETPHRITWDRQPRPTSHREERTDHNGLTVRDVHLCAHGHEAHVTGHEQCERLDDDLPHLHFEFDPTPHTPHPNALQRILRALRRK